MYGQPQALALTGFGLGTLAIGLGWLALLALTLVVVGAALVRLVPRREDL